LQPSGEDPRARGSDLLVHGVDIGHDLLQDLRRRRIRSGLIHAEQVLLHLLLLFHPHAPTQCPTVHADLVFALPEAWSRHSPSICHPADVEGFGVDLVEGRSCGE